LIHGGGYGSGYGAAGTETDRNENVIDGSDDDDDDGSRTRSASATASVRLRLYWRLFLLLHLKLEDSSFCLHLLLVLGFHLLEMCLGVLGLMQILPKTNNVFYFMFSSTNIYSNLLTALSRLLPLLLPLPLSPLAVTPA
jgi:hypothetical protein